jgi:hypothetical protein
VREQRLALDQGVPDVVPTHHRDLEDRCPLVLEMVLLEDAEAGAPRHVDVAVGGHLLPGKNPQESRLARTVGSHEAVAAAGIELQRDLREERVGAPGFGEIRDGNHGGEGV